MEKYAEDWRACFADEAVPLPLLKQRAFNLRWAEQPDDVIPLTAADPDFPIAEPIREALARHVRDGVMSYAPAQGLPVFRETVAEWLSVHKHYPCTADQVIATDSAAAAMETVARLLLGRGDEAIIFDPVDFLFATVTTRTGADVVRIPISMQSSDDEIIARLHCAQSRRTRVLWLCNPHNPLGRVFSRSLLERIGQWAIEHQITVVSDEIWSDIVYTPHHHTAIASLFPQQARHFISIYGFSKNFALAGLRIGCIVTGSQRWRQMMLEQSGANATIAGANVLAQMAVVAALTEARGWLQAFVVHLQQQRDLACARINQWPGVSVHKPQGTYVLFPNIALLSDDSELLCAELLAEARVALVPGASRWFGPGARGHLRLCLATSKQLLSEALDRLTPVIHRLAEQRSDLRQRLGSKEQQTA